MNSRFNAWYGEALSLVAGIATVFAFAPYRLYALLLLTIPLLLHVIQHPSRVRVFLRGYLFGIGLFGAGVSWVYNSIHQFGNAAWPVAGGLTALLVFYLALYPAFSALLTIYLYKYVRNGLRVLVFPSVWILLEWVRGWMITGFTWLDLGYSQTETFLMNWASIGGVYLIGWVLIVMLASIYFAFLQRKPMLYTWPAVLLLLTALVPLLVNHASQQTHNLKVSLVQGNVPQDQKWLPSQLGPTLKSYYEMTAKHWDSDVIIWPETAVPAFYHQVERSYLSRLRVDAVENDTTLMLGIPVLDQQQGTYTNSIVQLDAQDIFYHKKHLVPFGEYLPLKSWLQWLLDYLHIPMSDFSSGTGSGAPFVVRDVRVAASICYEIAYGNELIESARNAGMLVSVSNNAWFGDSLAPYQILQMAQMRAREFSRPIALSTNDGVTAIIDMQGEVQSRLPRFTREVLTDEVQVSTQQTLYMQMSDWPALILAVLSLVAAFYSSAGSRR